MGVDLAFRLQFQCITRKLSFLDDFWDGFISFEQYYVFCLKSILNNDVFETKSLR